MCYNNNSIANNSYNLLDSEESQMLMDEKGLTEEDIDLLIFNYEQYLAQNNEEYKQYLESDGHIDLLAIEYFPYNNFNSKLEKYLKTKNRTLDSAIRDYVPAKSLNSYLHGFLMNHGVNYDWVSSDLLGERTNKDLRSEFNEYMRCN